jgi:uncharacterized protein
MTDLCDLALITGASSGMGAALAERLARSGSDLVLVARRWERLEELATRLTDETGVHVKIVVADLTDDADVAHVESVCAEKPLDLLVNNAGFPGYGPFAEIDRDVATDLVGIHVLAPVRMTRAALPGMLLRRRGAIVNVASLLALSGPATIPLPGRATYAAAKSFLLTFTQALAGELEGSGVHAMVCLPGMVDSEFHGGGGRPGMPGSRIMSSHDAARAIIGGLRLGETVCLPGVEDVTSFGQLCDLQQSLMAAGNNTSRLASRYR